MEDLGQMQKDTRLKAMGRCRSASICARCSSEG
jgi:hypothetical protein